MEDCGDNLLRIVLIALLSLVLSACGETMAVRWTVTMSLPAGAMTKTSVVRVTFRRYPAPLDNTQVALCGVGLVYDLGEKGELVAALRTSDGLRTYPAAGVVSLLAYYYGAMPPTRSIGSQPLEMITGARRRVIVDPENYPEFIWFSDVEQPSTARIMTASDLRQIDPNIAVLQETIEPTNVAPDKDFHPTPIWMNKIRPVSQRMPAHPPQVFIRNIPFTLDQVQDCSS